MFWILIVIVAMVVAAIAITVSRGLQLRSLAAHGVSTQGRIDRKWRHMGSGGRSTKRLRYTFSDSEGREHSRAIMVSEGEFDAHSEGQAVNVVYLPTKPRTNALESMVELARDALKK